MLRFFNQIAMIPPRFPNPFVLRTYDFPASISNGAGTDGRNEITRALVRLQAKSDTLSNREYPRQRPSCNTDAALSARFEK
jgi:hypothetical protein